MKITKGQYDLILRRQQAFAAASVEARVAQAVLSTAATAMNETVASVASDAGTEEGTQFQGFRLGVAANGEFTLDLVIEPTPAPAASDGLPPIQ